jgi:ribosomal protein S18 acetylase RimI-like enzyme
MTPEFDLPFPQYRCPSCGKDLPLGEARITVTCGEHVSGEPVDFAVRQATDADRSAIEAICDQAYGETDVDVFGKTYDVLSGTNIIAEKDGELLGLISVAIDHGDAVMTLMSVYPQYQGKGVGSALVDDVLELASERGLASVRTAVTNDDVSTLYFFLRHGFTIYDCAIGEVVDRLGSAVPGFSGIPVRDEIRLRRGVC